MVVLLCVILVLIILVVKLSSTVVALQLEHDEEVDQIITNYEKEIERIIEVCNHTEGAK